MTKRALITGGAKGIGLAIGRRVSRDGIALTLLARDRAALERAARELDATFEVADVTDPDALTAAIHSAGPFDILINNAGGATSAPFLETTPHDWQAMLSLNLSSTLAAIHAALPHMLDRGWGRIVNIASTAGLKGYPYTAAYAASKHAVIGATRSLAIEFARTGVTINAVCPGFTDTDLVARAAQTIAARTVRSDVSARADLARYNPQGRLVAPEEVAEAVAFLCSDAASAMTGQSIAVAGGEVM